MAKVLLNVADIRHRSRVNGPGVRSVVWVQGCTIGCPGCFNPHTQAHQPVRLLDPEKLGRELSALDDVDGLTISGGEPFEQAEACAILASTVHQQGRSVMAFSGYQFEYLRSSSVAGVQRLLATIDLLVAGPYIERLQADGTLWRGSTNQTVHVLSDRLKHAVDHQSDDMSVVEIATDGRAVSATGFPDKEDWLWLERMAGTSKEPCSRSRDRSNRPSHGLST